MDDELAPILLYLIFGLTLVLVFCGLIWAARQDGVMQRHHERLARQ